MTDYTPVPKSDGCAEHRSGLPKCKFCQKELYGEHYWLIGKGFLCMSCTKTQKIKGTILVKDIGVQIFNRQEQEGLRK